MIAAVVVDLDGVLIDSEPVWEQVRRTYVAECGGRWPADAQDRLMGMSTPEWARYLNEEPGVGQQPAAVATAVVERFAVTVSTEEVPRGTSDAHHEIEPVWLRSAIRWKATGSVRSRRP